MTDDFPCPRCHATTTGRFYGPCEACREQLRAAVAGGKRDIVVEAYEPKMNVTANAVALRDD